MGGRGTSSMSSKKNRSTTSFSMGNMKNRAHVSDLLTSASANALSNPAYAKKALDSAIKFMENSNHANKNAIIERLQDAKKLDIDNFKAEYYIAKGHKGKEEKLEKEIKTFFIDLSSYISRTYQGD